MESTITRICKYTYPIGGKAVCNKVPRTSRGAVRLQTGKGIAGPNGFTVRFASRAQVKSMSQELQNYRPANLPGSIIPEVVWIEVLPEDVLSGLKSLPAGIEAEGRIIAEPGRGVDTTLKWAKDELALAEQLLPDRERHASQAIIHAQCAVECLLDTYLERDWLIELLPSKPRMNQKVRWLSGRPSRLSERTLCC